MIFCIRAMICPDVPFCDRPLIYSRFQAILKGEHDDKDRLNIYINISHT